ncbi:MAG: hypothetical protein EAZ89_16935 [Bacteroidetes bacterium]|nr:MAG: hypothetical protein EAZ89_16935 [Bacteroidota bacterium]
MVLTRVEMMGVTILEPVTSLTDLITATVCFVSYYRLIQNPSNELAHRLLRNYFLFMGLTTAFAGVIGHALLYLVTPDWKAIGWTCSALAIFCIERSSILSSPVLTDVWKKRLTWLAGLQFVLFMLLIINPPTRSFDTVKLNSAIGLGVFTLAVQAAAYRKDLHQGRRWIIGSILFGLIPAYIYNAEISLHTWFNFHDISHVLMATAMYIMYIGARDISHSPMSQAS